MFKLNFSIYAFVYKSMYIVQVTQLSTHANKYSHLELNLLLLFRSSKESHVCARVLMMIKFVYGSEWNIIWKKTSLSENWYGQYLYENPTIYRITIYLYFCVGRLSLFDNWILKRTHKHCCSVEKQRRKNTKRENNLRRYAELHCKMDFFPCEI